MDSKASPTPLETRLAEFCALDELERLVYQKDEIDQERARSLATFRQSIAPESSQTTISSTRSQFLHQIDSDIEAYTSKRQVMILLSDLDTSPDGRLWAESRDHLAMIEQAKEEYSKALLIAKERISPALFWSQIAQAQYWVDLKLPREDIIFRTSVNRLNQCKTSAYKFYRKEGPSLRAHHQKRLSLINEILGLPSAASLSPTLSEWTTEGSEPSLESPKEESENGEELQGLFNPMEYINFMNGGKKSSPILGSELGSSSGTLARQILGATHNTHSPPVPLLTAPLPEASSIVDSMKCAFELEEKSSKETIYHALCSILDPPNGGLRVDKGWLLGLVLVNLPRPLVWLNEERVKAFRTSLPRDQITFIFQRGTEEYNFFKDLWRHTNDVNIQLAASAITQVKDTERIMCDIRSKWQIDVDMPLPARRKWSEDEGSGRPSKLFGNRRRSSGESGRNGTN